VTYLSVALVWSTVSAAGASEAEKPIRSASCQNASALDESTFARLVDSFFDFKFKTDPDSATILGLHNYDSLAPQMSEQAIRAEIRDLKAFQQKFAALENARLGARSKIDLLLIVNHIKTQLLDLEEIESWKKNPDIYSSHSSSMIYDLISRDFSPLSERLRCVIAREKKIAPMLAAAKANLKNPPAVYTEIALEQLPGMLDLFEKSLPEKFKPVSDARLRAEFQCSNRQAISALKDYEKFLKENLLPRSRGSFALGESLFARKLLYEEMEDTPLNRLLALGESELRRLQQEFVKTAAEMDSTRSAAEVYSSIASNHTTPDRLLSSMQEVLDRLRDFCLAQKIISIPAREPLTVVETPPFMRALTFAAMDAPGPFEQKARQAYYYVTLPEPKWNPARIEEHMRAFSKYDLLNTSVHEAYPGHFLQGLFLRRAPSKTARILESDSFTEGWAHYCEQMMVEEGLLNNDRDLKLTMLHDALLRCCRYIVGIKMHTRNMSMDEAVKFFVREGYQEKANAEREVKRGTADPTYLVYTLGRLQILALRDEYKILKGNKFKLIDFHDQLLSAGSPPIKVIRGLLLSDSK
jgi:uncharacterized protein (DUF885 family)